MKTNRNLIPICMLTAVVLELTWMVMPAAGQNSFAYTAGSLNTARDGHTATLLPNGQVLVAGGQGINSVLSSAELYNPATGTWTATGSMTEARVDHTATLLPNGQVLVAGGYGNSGVLSSAELYNPATGTWTATSPLNNAREGHTTTLLPNGQVLVAGGADANGDSLSSAELYNPATGFWTMANSLNNARQLHTATLLPNGQVLVAAGYDGGDFIGTNLSSAELYNPATGTWTLTNSLNTGRFGHTATLLPNGQVLVAAGYASSSVLSSAELYNPATGTWTVTNSLNTARYEHSATLLANGQILIAGGVGGNSAILSSAELYNPAMGTWAVANSLNTARENHTATLLPDGQVLIAGGGGNSAYLSSSELFNSAAGTWTATNSLNNARDYQTATLLPDGQVLVAGGLFGSGHHNSTYLSSVELYNPVAGTWTVTNSMNTGREVHTATLLPNGQVLVAGGYGNSGFLSSAELYNPATGTWTVTGSLNNAHYEHTATLLPNGQVLVAGGYNTSGVVSSAELYNPATGTWTVTGSLNTARDEHTATLLPNGQVLVAGGYGNSGFLSSAELYNPATGTWTQTGSLNTACFAHTATLLPNGQVLVAGGEGNGVYVSSAELYNPVTGTWTVTGTLNTAHVYHTATLLPNGRVLVAGGEGSGGYDSSAELYNPATGTWTLTGSLNTARYAHTATLLPNGQILVAGGDNTSGYLSSAEIYDVGLGFSSSWQPQIASVNSPLVLGGSLVLTGSQFRGVSEGSGGNTQNSPTDYPVVQLRSLGNEQTVYLSSTNWSASSYVSAAVSGLPSGWLLATIFVNGIPSPGVITVTSATNEIVTATSDSGPGSLRQAINDAYAGQTITFTPNVSGATITLASTLTLNTSLTIDASALPGGIQINGNGSLQVFNVASNNTVVLNSLTISNGYDSEDGGGIYNSGTLTLNQCTLAGNIANDGTGGGVYNAGTLTVNECTLTGNSAGLAGAGIGNRGTLTLNQSTLSGNFAADGGGGVDNEGEGTLTVNQSTLSGNSDGIFTYNGVFSLFLTNSIVAGNLDGDIIFYPNTVSYGGANIVQNFSGSFTGPAPINAAPLLAPLGNYGGPTQTMPPLPGSPAIDAGSDAATNIFAIDQRGYPRLEGLHVDIGAVELPTLQFTASPTNAPVNFPVQFTCPSIDSDGSTITQWQWDFGDGTTTTAQSPSHSYSAAGSFYPSLLVTNCLGLTLSASGPAVTTTVAAIQITVNGSNQNYGAQLALGGSSGNGQLLVNNAGQFQSAGAILGGSGVPNNLAVVSGTGSVWTSTSDVVVGQTGSGNQLIVTNGGAMVVSGNLTVGSASSANNLVQISNGTLIVTNSSGTGTLTVNNGSLLFNGGTLIVNVLVITNASGSLTFSGGVLEVTSAVVSNGVAFTIGDGTDSATITLEGGTNLFENGFAVADNATINGNGTVVSPSGILIEGTVSPGHSPGQLVLNGNVSLQGTAYMEIDKTAPTNDLITGVGQLSFGGTLQVSLLNGTTLAAGDSFQMFSASNYVGTFAAIIPSAPGASLAWDTQALYTTGKIVAVGPPQIVSLTANQVALVGTNVNLSVVATGGTPTLYYQWLFNNSPLSLQTNATLTLSAVTTNNSGNYSVVVHNTFLSVTSTVTTLTVILPTVQGLVTTTNDMGIGSLRLAINNAVADENITFATNLSGQTITLASTLTITTNLTIDASALLGGIHISGNGSVQVFNVASNSTVVLNSLTISSGNLYGNNGGGGIANYGTLTLNECTLSGNSTVYTELGGGCAGGGIANYGTLTLNECTLSGNTVNAFNPNTADLVAQGGAIANDGALTLNQCTLSGNNANAEGGGIYNYGTLTLNQSTLSGNSTVEAGGGIFNLGTLTITNSIVAGNSGGVGADIYNYGAILTFGGSNIVQYLYNDDGGTANGTTPIYAAPNLSALGNYGGPTQTMPPLPGSPAIDAGSDAATNLFASDQRGYPRLEGLYVDIGAVELPTLQYTAYPSNPPVALAVQFTCTNVDSEGSPITNWNWNFGDGSGSINQNPTHVYAATGTFPVALTVANSLGLKIVGSGPVINVSPPIVYTANPTNGTIPVTVQFTGPDLDGYGNTINQWSWTFGDGSTGIAQNAATAHVYTNTGSFYPSVGLGASGETVYGPAITVIPPPNWFLFTTNADGSLNISQYAGSGGTVTIPSTTNGLPVTTIGNNAFDYSYWGVVTNVTIPASITNIGIAPFSACNSLISINVAPGNAYYSSVNGVLFNFNQTTLIEYPAGNTATSYTIPNSVTNIEPNAFQDCTNLTSVLIPDTVTSLEYYLFYGCTSLTNIIIGSGVTSIADAAFEDCENLTSITIPNSVTNLGDFVFNSCYSLTNIIIGSSVSSIGEFAFGNCTSLANVTIPASVTNLGTAPFYIGSTLFSGCSSLTAINVAPANASYSSVNGILFDKYQALLIAYPPAKAAATYTIPGSVTTIGDAAFSSCLSLTNVIIGNSVTSIGDEAFSGCDNTSSVLLGTNVTSIGYAAFNECGLTSATIPDSVTYLGESAFFACGQLTNAIIGKGVNLIGGYAFDLCWSLSSVTMGTNVTEIEFHAFAACSALTSIIIPNSVIFIDEDAFEYCYNLTNVTMGSAVTFIDSGAFDFCANLKAVYFEGNAPSLPYNGNGYNGFGYGSVVFSNDNQVTMYYLPATAGWTGTYDGHPTALWTLLGPFNFTITNATITLTGYAGSGGVVAIPATIIGLPVVGIANNAFQSTYNLTNITIPMSVTNIGNTPFTGCNNLTSINVDPANSYYSSVNGVLFDKNHTTLIEYPEGAGNFYAIPEGVTNIAFGAFSDCSSLTGVTIPSSVTSIGENAFFVCGLTNVTIPNSVTTLGELAFNNCSSLTNVMMGTNVTSIEVDTFAGCYNLASINIANSITSIGTYAFWDCLTLTSVTIPAAVTNIDNSAFEECRSLTAINVDPANSFYSSVNGVLFDKSQTTLVEFPDGKAGSYTIPSGITSIADAAFEECENLTSITVPNSVTNLGGFTFAYCFGLTNIIIGSGITSIASEEFYGCYDLPAVYFQGNAPVDNSPFYDQTLTVYYLPGTTGWGATFGGEPTMLWNPQVPIITQQPASEQVYAFSNATFEVYAAGVPTLNYQWQKNGTNLTDGGNIYGSATTTLTLSAATTNDVGYYSVVVANSYGSVTSLVAQLGITAITTVNGSNQNYGAQLVLGGSSGNGQLLVNNAGQFQSAGAILGGSGVPNNLAVVSGTGSVWTSTGNIVVGQTGSGNQLLVTNGGAMVVSGNLTVGSASSANNLVQISNGTLIVTNSSGTGTLTVNNGSLLFNGGTLIVNVLVITNASGSLTFSGGVLEVTSAVVSNGVAFTIGDGTDSATITLEGGTNLFENGFAVADNATINGNGTVVSPSGILVGGTASPGHSPGQLVLNGNVSLQGTAYMEIDKTAHTNDLITGVGQLSFGGTLQVSLLNGTTLAAGDSFRLFSASNYAGTFATIIPPTPGAGLAWETQTLYSNGVLTIGGVPQIVSLTTNRMALAGSTVNFSVVATGGTPTLDYQWLFNNNPLSVQTNATLTLSAVTTNNGGNYAVVVNNGYSSVTSAVTRLTVVLTSTNYPPRFQTMAVNGGSFQFTWNTVNAFPAVGYQVQYTTNLASQNWVNLGGVLTGAGPTISATDMTSINAQRFYRVLLVQ